LKSVSKKTKNRAEMAAGVTSKLRKMSDMITILEAWKSAQELD